MCKPKWRLEKESYRLLQGPLAFLLPTGSPSSIPFAELVSAGPSPGRGSPFLPFQKKGLPRGLWASQSYTYQRSKGEHWKPAPRAHTLLSPPPPAGGKVTSGSSLRTLCPRISSGRKLLRPAPCALEAAALLMFGRWLRLGTCRLGPFANFLELNELSPTWAREARLEAGWQCSSRHRPAVVR